jgi:thioesterase domain-containing protein/acyl carrier protein
LSAKTMPSLQESRRLFADYLLQEKTQKDVLADMAYTLQVGRNEFDYRWAAICSTQEDAIKQITDFSNPVYHIDRDHTNPMECLIFSFGAESSDQKKIFNTLYDFHKGFKDSIIFCFSVMPDTLRETYIGKIIKKYSFDRDMLLNQFSILEQQMIQFVNQYAMGQLLLTCQIKPEVLQGVQVGYWVALCLAEVFSVKETLSLIEALYVYETLQSYEKKREKMRELVALYKPAPPSIPIMLLDENDEWFAYEDQSLEFLLKNAITMATSEIVSLQFENACVIQFGDATRQFSNGSDCFVVKMMDKVSQDEQYGDLASLLDVLKSLWVHGVFIDWHEFYQEHKRQRIPLPTYSFLKQRYWIASNAAPGKTKERLKENIQFYDTQWVPLILEATQQGTLTAHDTVLVIMSDPYVADQWMKQFKQRRIRAIVANSVFWHADPQEHEKAMGQFFDEYGVFTTIVYADNLASTMRELDNKSINKHIHYLHYLVSFLKSYQQYHAMEHPLKLIVLVQGVTTHDMTTLLDPLQASIVGMLRVIPQEYKNIRCYMINYPFPQQKVLRHDGIAELMDTLMKFQLPIMTSYDQGEWYTQRVEPVMFNTDQNNIQGQYYQLRVGGVYLLTGGLGKIGRALVDFLTTRYAARCVLVTRSSTDVFCHGANVETSTLEATLAHKVQWLNNQRAKGADICILQADVSDEKAMLEVFQWINVHYPRLDGVFHLAGQTSHLVFTAIAQTSIDILYEQFLPKVQGAIVLSHCLRQYSADFCVLFSSLSSILGGVGFSAYASANAFLDAFALYQNQQTTTPWISIQWDGWNFEEGSDPKLTIRDWFLPHEGVMAFAQVMAQGRLGVLAVTKDLYPEKKINLSKKEKNDFFNQCDTQDEPISLALLRQVHAIFCHCLGVSTLDNDTDFFDAGGDSMTALELITAFEKAFGLSPGLHELYELTTVTQVSRWLAEHTAKKTFPNLVLPLRKNNTSVETLFLFHPLGGTAFCYRKLLAYLDENIAVYGIQNPGVEFGYQPFASIREMAQVYADAIQTIPSQGGYILGGSSMGGNIALEVAELLEARGKEVTSVFLMDSWAQLPEAFAEYSSFLMHSQHIMDDLLLNVPEHLSKQKEKLRQYTWETMQLLLNYHPRLPQCPVFLYKAKTCLPEYAKNDSADNHWSEVCQRKLHVIDVEGDHITLLQEPFVADLGQVLNEQVLELAIPITDEF